MLVVGLTGGIACGKSTVSTLLSQYNVPVVDADTIAREVVQPGRRAHRQIVAAFGGVVPGLVDPTTQELDRAALGKAVFGDPHQLRKLNRIVHPAVKREIAWQVLRAYLRFEPMVVLDVPLLFESGLNLVCGATVSVSCDREVQMARLRLRNPQMSPQEAEQRVASQSLARERDGRADIVIDNNGDRALLERQVELVVRRLTPHWAWTAAAYVPLVGVALAAYAVVAAYLRDRQRQRALKRD
jgi:dephospho-CoA kinase